MAFAIESFSSGKKDDSHYLKWVARLFLVSDGKVTIKFLPLSPCNESDFELFNQPDEASADKVARYRKNGGFYCLDWRNYDIQLYSSWRSGSSYTAIDVMAVPCGYQFDKASQEYDDSECNWDLQKAIEYLHVINILVYHNHGVFVEDAYGEERL